MSDKTKIIYVHETVWQSWGRDIGSYFAVLALIGTGVYLQSTPMQWVGFLGVIVSVSAKAKSLRKYTPQQAADMLRDDFGVVAIPAQKQEAA